MKKSNPINSDKGIAIWYFFSKKCEDKLTQKNLEKPQKKKRENKTTSTLDRGTPQFSINQTIQKPQKAV